MSAAQIPHTGSEIVIKLGRKINSMSDARLSGQLVLFVNSFGREVVVVEGRQWNGVCFCNGRRSTQ